MKTASEKVKAKGLKSLKQMSEMVKRPVSTLHNWHREYPDLFNLLLLGCSMSVLTRKPMTSEATKALDSLAEFDEG